MKILVLPSFRTASTFLCEKLASDHGLQNYDEGFHSSMALAKLKTNLYKMMHSDNWIVKVMPCHNDNYNDHIHDGNLIQTLVERSDRVIVLLRKDVNQQIRSFWLAITLSHLIEEGNIQLPEWHDEFSDCLDMNHLAPSADYSDWSDYIQRTLPSCVHLILGDVRYLKRLAQDNPKFEMMYTEDMPGQRYQRPVIYPVGFPDSMTDIKFDQL